MKNTMPQRHAKRHAKAVAMVDIAPYRIEGAALISFSGGRSSGLMLHEIVRAHGGRLPNSHRVCFANTGRERPETLDFVQRCSEEWGIHVTWLEWRDNDRGYEIVNHDSASRNGAPFEALIRKKGYLPNPVARYCTTDLKIRPMKKFIENGVGLGRCAFTTVIGFRADEMRRVRNAKARCSSRKDAWLSVACPMAEAGIAKRGVREFWNRQPFDLALEDHEGNCDVCFLKGQEKRRRIMFDRPGLAEWWIRMEDERGATFRPPHRPNYRHLFQSRRRQEAFDFPEDPLDFCMGCTD